VAPAGRADDFSWPRRGVAPLGTDPLVTTTSMPMTPMQPEHPAVAAAPVPPRPAREGVTRSRIAQQQPSRPQRQYVPRRQPPAFYFPFFRPW